MAVMLNDQASRRPGCEPIEELFEALESPLLSYALRLSGDLSAAEDLVQEAFMKLQTHFAEVREPRRWLYRTVHNLALNRRRDGRKIVPMEAGRPGETGQGDAADPAPLPDEQLVRMEGIGLVRLTLASLDERSRELIRLKFTENLSYKEMSGRTGLTTGNVGYILHCALKSMAEELARKGVLP
ncbi:MAG TPA: RNA polymerase sigma factor [Candidatus Acidoferrum sp.]|nr:RNA polymerase sigma factor [Candidatus Acidoferrum sp.]